MINRQFSPEMPQNELLAYWDIILRRRWLVLFCLVAVVTLTAIASFKAKHIYKATAQILIEKESANMALREGVAIDISGLDYYQTQYRIIRSRSIAKNVYDNLNLSQDEEFKTNNAGAIDNFLKHIIVEPIRGSRLVNLSAESYSAVKAAQIANAVADEYVKQNLENKLFASREILKKLPENATIDDLANSEIIEALPSVVSNTLLQALKTELIKYESEYADLSERYKPKHPSLQTVQARIEVLKKRINSELQNIVESIRTELSGEYKSNNVRILDYAEVPDHPVRPRRSRNVILSFIMGLVFGIGLAFFTNYIDNTLKTAEDIEQYIGLPFLGFSPVISNHSESSLFAVENPNSAEAEAIKTIRTNLIFSAPEDKLKAMLITSCSPGEGKTFISMNVAASFAQAGKNTLLVDTDLRRNTLSKSMKLNKSRGLSDFLVGEVEAKDIIQDTEMKNLKFISSGSHTPDPAELLSSDRLKAFLEIAKAQFDRVIFDSAPVLPVSDTLNITNLMDGVVMVVHTGKTSRNVVNLGKLKLLGVRARINGIILNYVNLKSSGYSGYGYYSYSENY